MKLSPVMLKILRRAPVHPQWPGRMLSSCWTGRGASKRMMNILSPKMPEKTFRTYLQWQLNRGCNCAHAILANQKDGEFAGYSPWGPNWSRKIHQPTVSLMLARAAAIRASGMALAIWSFTDQSDAYVERPLAEHAQFFTDCSIAGLFNYANLLVLGLELDEYWSAHEVAARVPLLRAAAPHLPIGLHQTSGRLDYAAMADIVFYQVEPGRTASQIQADTRSALRRIAYTRPLVFFELARTENNPLATAALSAGAAGVGNW